MVQSLGHPHVVQHIKSLAVSPFSRHLPAGVTIHYTAGPTLAGCISTMKQTGLGYHFIIDRDGTIHETSRLDCGTYHAGRAKWNGLSPNRTHLSIALVSWGKLNDKGLTWAMSEPDSEVERHGHKWHPATPKQEEALLQLCVRLMKEFSIGAADFCGHSECALPAGRKVDIGGTFSITMSELRKILADSEP